MAYYLRTTLAPSGARYLRAVIEADVTAPVIHVPVDPLLYFPFGSEGLSQGDPELQLLLASITATDETHPVAPQVFTDIALLGDPIAPGTHEITAWATDAALNTGYATFWLTVEEAAADVTPDPFHFIPVLDAQPGSLVSSNLIQVAGVDLVDLPISIAGGEYSVAGEHGPGLWTTEPGTVRLGDQVRVRLTANAAWEGVASATLTISEVSAAFVVTTMAFPKPVLVGAIPSRKWPVGRQVTLHAAAHFTGAETYAATGLPSGFLIDTLSGLITGTATQPSDEPFAIQITATNEGGTTASNVFQWRFIAIQRADGITPTYRQTDFSALVRAAERKPVYVPEYEFSGRTFIKRDVPGRKPD